MPSDPSRALAAGIGLSRLARYWALSAGVFTGLAYCGLMTAYEADRLHLAIAAAVFAAAVISSVVGFAFSAVCGAMLLHLIDSPVRCVQIMMICCIAGQLLMVWSVRRHIEWNHLAVFLPGAVLGLPVGLLVLLNAQASYGRAIGLLLVAYALFALLRPAIVLGKGHPLLDAAVGFLGGVTGAAAAFPGAFVTIWCGLKGWSKERQRGLYQPFILITQIAGFILLCISGVGTSGAASVRFEGVLYLPAVMLGTFVGMSCFKCLNDRQFAIAANLLLIVSGVSLLA